MVDCLRTLLIMKATTVIVKVTLVMTMVKATREDD